MNWSALLVAEVPFGVVTVTSTAPLRLTTGLVAMICVSLLTVKLLAAVEPKAMPVAPLNPVPVMVTLIPPLAGPLVGLIPVTVGAASVVI